MTHPAAEPLAAARALVENAKGTPLGSGLKLNREELLELLDQAVAAVNEAMTEPSESALSEEELAQARAEADRILAEARTRADELVSDAEVVKAADAEAQALMAESDTWVDTRLAEFETGLQRTLEQIETLRDRLAARSREGEADDRPGQPDDPDPA